MGASTHSQSIAYIGIGSNLGNPPRQVQQAIATLSQWPGITLLSLSPWYGSSPVGGEPGQPDYLNGVICLGTALSPHALLDVLQHIEHAQGRERLTRWGARTLDLDLLLYDALTLSDERLTLPHPRLHERAFVLRPLTDIAPQLVLPNQASVASLLAALSPAGTWRLPPTEPMPDTDNENPLQEPQPR